MKALLLTACLIASAAAPAADHLCGPQPKGAHLMTDEITLDRQARGGPAFYVRIGRTVVFMRPDDVFAVARDISGAFAAAIEADLPLKEDTDLDKYSLRGKSFENISRGVMAALLEKGRASLVDWRHIGDTLNPDLADQKIVRRTSIYEGGRETQRTLCTSTGDILAVPHYEMH